MIKIAFVGKSKEANTFCARYLWQKYKFRFMGLDDELDKFLRKIYNREHFKRKPEFLNYQTKLKFYDVWQRLDPDIWVNRVLHRLSDPRWTRNVVIPDARYMNEVKALEAAGFIFIRVSVDDKFYSKKTTSIKTLNSTVNPGAVDYYEWFSKDADFFIKAKYSIHLDSYESMRKSLDEIVKNLTIDNPLPDTSGKWPY